MTVPPPPRLSDLRAGTVLAAGLGASIVTPDIDFETYSEAGFLWDEDAGKWVGPPGSAAHSKGLPAVGAAVYSADPSCELLCASYDLKDGRGRRRWRPGMVPPIDLFEHVIAGRPLEAWNVGFERWVWEHVCTPRLGWPAVAPDQWRCAMAKARAHALPGKLAEAGRVLALDVQKDKDGKRLLDKFSMPRKPTKADPRLRTPLIWTEADAEREIRELTEVHGLTVAAAHKLISADRDDTERLAAYNETDIATEAEAAALIPDLSVDELRFWQDDQRINKRGVAIDLDSVHACIAIIEQAQKRYGEELIALTGCKPTELAKLTGWLHGRGVHLDSLDEDAVEAALAGTLPPDARRALQIRAAVGSGSVKKVFAMRNQALNGRLHDLYSYHAARTGRPTGNGPQPTNLPKAGPNVYRCPSCKRHHGAHTMHCHWCGTFTMRAPGSGDEWTPEAMDDALEAISHRSLDWLEVLFGEAMLTLAGCLRGLFVAALGRELVSSDFTAIEGVVVACIAGEQWRIDAYANDEPMYLLSAERMFGVPVAEMKEYAKVNGRHHPLRQKGKGGELGLGFGGWITALRQFGVDGPDDELKDTVLAWRRASPHLEWLWGGQKKGKADGVRQNAGLARGYVDTWDSTPEFYGLEGAAIQAVMAPGIAFPVLRMDGTHCGVTYEMRGDVLYCTTPSGGTITYHRPRLQQGYPEWRGLQLSFEGWNTNPKNGPMGWVRMNTYSGKLAENCLAAGTLVLTARGWTRIESVRRDDLVHDGVEFVGHAGSVFQSFRACVSVDGVFMTPDHEVLTDAGWQKAGEAPTPTRPTLRDVDGALPAPRDSAEVALRVRLPDDQGERPRGRTQGHRGRENVELRLQDEGVSARGESHARHDGAPRVRSVAQPGRPLHVADASSVEKLRRAGHLGLRALARVVRELLGGHGAYVRARPADRTRGQRGGVLPDQLHVGDEGRASAESAHQRHDRDAERPAADVGSRRTLRHQQDDAALPHENRASAVRSSAPVFDILDCGPRHRFVVLGSSGPFIVHNCVQKTARDIQMPAIHRCETMGYPVVMHTYDEIVAEVPVGAGSVEEMERIMTTPLPWSAGWPIKAAGGWRGTRYRKG